MLDHSKGVLEHEVELAVDHEGRNLDRIRLDQLFHNLVSQHPAASGVFAGGEVLAKVVLELGEGVVLAEVLGEVVVEVRQDLSLQLFEIDRPLRTVLPWTSSGPSSFGNARSKTF